MKREIMSEIAKSPGTLAAIPVVWPKAWLLDPTKQPSQQAFAEDPGYLKNFLDPRFLSADGAVMLPKTGDPDYTTFLGWTSDSENDFGLLAYSVSGDILSAIDKCSLK